MISNWEKYSLDVQTRQSRRKFENEPFLTYSPKSIEKVNHFGCTLLRSQNFISLRRAAFLKRFVKVGHFRRTDTAVEILESCEPTNSRLTFLVQLYTYDKTGDCCHRWRPAGFSQRSAGRCAMTRPPHSEIFGPAFNPQIPATISGGRVPSVRASQGARHH